MANVDARTRNSRGTEKLTEFAADEAFSAGGMDEALSGGGTFLEPVPAIYRQIEWLIKVHN